jgi:uncharacterized membrane protein YhaH (DUF805 family)
MGAGTTQIFSCNGYLSRDEYRRWLPLIIAFQLALFLFWFRYAVHGSVNMTDFGIIGLAAFLAGLVCFIGWLTITSKRLRAADISRGWLILAVLVINLPIGGVYINFSMIAAFLLTIIAAVARDRMTATV